MKHLLKKVLPIKLLRLLQKPHNPENESAINLNDYYLLDKSKVTYAQDLLYTFHSADFMNDPHFLKSYDLGKHTDGGKLLNNYDIHWRLHVICWAAYHASHLEGDFVDCGAGSGIFARAVINYIGFENLEKKYYLLDTFSGMDERYSTTKEMERHEILGYGKAMGLYDQVKETFKNFNVKIIKGTVPETLIQTDTTQVCFLSIDMNSVQPEVEALEFFWDKMVSGGIIILDDYGYANAHNDQKEAHNAFAKAKGVQVLALPTCQGLIVKP